MLGRYLAILSNLPAMDIALSQPNPMIILAFHFLRLHQNHKYPAKVQGYAFDVFDEHLFSLADIGKNRGWTREIVISCWSLSD